MFAGDLINALQHGRHLRALFRTLEGLGLRLCSLRVLCVLARQFAAHLEDLRLFLLALFGRAHDVARGVEQLRHLLRARLVRAIVEAGVAGLHLLEEFVVADLDKAAAHALDVGGVRTLEHLHGVLPRLHAQAEVEAGVGPDLVADGVGGLLRGQNEVNAQRAAHARGADQLGHELRLLALEFGKFIDDDDEVRQLHALLLAELAGIVVDVVDADRLEDALAAVDLAVERGQGPVDDARALQVVDDAGHVGQGAESVRHAAALVVDEDELHLPRAVIERQGEYVGSPA